MDSPISCGDCVCGRNRYRHRSRDLLQRVSLEMGTTDHRYFFGVRSVNRYSSIVFCAAHRTGTWQKANRNQSVFVCSVSRPPAGFPKTDRSLCRDLNFPRKRLRSSLVGLTPSCLHFSRTSDVRLYICGIHGNGNSRRPAGKNRQKGGRIIRYSQFNDSQTSRCWRSRHSRSDHNCFGIRRSYTWSQRKIHDCYQHFLVDSRWSRFLFTTLLYFVDYSVFDQPREPHGERLWTWIYQYCIWFRCIWVWWFER